MPRSELLVAAAHPWSPLAVDMSLESLPPSSHDLNPHVCSSPLMKGPCH